jgi:cytochrome c
MDRTISSSDRLARGNAGCEGVMYGASKEGRDTMKKAGFLITGITVALTLTSGLAFAGGDSAKGSKVFKKCIACHTADDSAKKKSSIGPSLATVFGRDSASISGYRFSPAMRKAKIKWTEENLDSFLDNPRGFVRGTRMIFPGLRNKQDRDDIIAFLKEAAKKGN